MGEGCGDVGTTTSPWQHQGEKATRRLGPRHRRHGDPGWPLTPEAFHSLPVHVLIAEADERFLDGSL